MCTLFALSNYCLVSLSLFFLYQNVLPELFPSFKLQGLQLESGSISEV